MLPQEVADAIFEHYLPRGAEETLPQGDAGALLGIADRIALERVNVTSKETNADVMSCNPLNKIPTLLLDDGSIMIDSPVIAEYLDETFGKGELFGRDTARLKVQFGTTAECLPDPPAMTT